MFFPGRRKGEKWGRRREGEHKFICDIWAFRPFSSPPRSRLSMTVTASTQSKIMSPKSLRVHALPYTNCLHGLWLCDAALCPSHVCPRKQRASVRGIESEAVKTTNLRWLNLTHAVMQQMSSTAHETNLCKDPSPALHIFFLVHGTPARRQ